MEDKKLPAQRETTDLTNCKNTLPGEDALSDLTCRMLIREAKEAMKLSYSPYSNFKVGAALMTKAGKVYRGCNIENAAYSVANCAERTALFKAVSEGERDFAAIAVVGGMNGVLTEYAAPCGVCRQALNEFTDADRFFVILATDESEYTAYTLAELLPLGFKL